MRGLRDGLLSVLPGMHPIRAEPARRGAGKNSYVKFGFFLYETERW